MIQIPPGNRKQIANTLDVIWQSSLPRLEIAESASKILDPISVLIVASLDICSHLHWLPSSLTIDNNETAIIATFADPRDEACISPADGTSTDVAATLEYADLGVSFHMRHIAFRSSSLPLFTGRLANTLAIFQYCRDHVDSLIYLPFEERQKRFVQAAADFGVDVDTFRFVAANINSMLRLVV